MQDQQQLNIWQRLKSGFRNLRGSAPEPVDQAKLDAEFEELRHKAPTPVFWMFGKTQSGKTSVVRFLTGATDAEIGNGFRPCTRTSRMFPFPNDTAPVLTFLDTRGVDEPSYDATEDLGRFNAEAHLVLVTCRLKDFATGRLRESLQRIRAADTSRPVMLLLTCLHESFPQQQHPQPYPFDATKSPIDVAEGNWPIDLIRLVREQSNEFAGLVDRVVPVDLTVPEDGFADTNYGGAMLKQVLREMLPDAYRATFRRVVETDPTRLDAEHRTARPVILGFATMATTAASLPLTNWLVVPSIQERMLKQLATDASRPAAAEDFLKKIGGWNTRSQSRLVLAEFLRVVPVVGAAANMRMAGKTTYALGQAFITYLHETRLGAALSNERIQQLYEKEFQSAEHAWNVS